MSQKDPVDDTQTTTTDESASSSSGGRFRGRRKSGEDASSPKERPERAAKKSSTKGEKGAIASASDKLRSRIASLVWLVAVLCALTLAVGALLVALEANQDNAVVAFVLDAADSLDLGVFSRENGIFTDFSSNPEVKSALVNWGIGAVAYLVVGKVLDRLIRP